MDTPRFVVVGNPENRRVAFFQTALASQGVAPAVVVAWHDLLTGRDALEAHAREGTVVRVESPGENTAVELALIARGADAIDHGGASRIDARGALALGDDKGRIRYPRQWYLGLCDALGAIGKALDATGARAMNAPDECAVMFDKALCWERFERAGVPVAPVVRARDGGAIGSYEALRAAMARDGVARVFVKPRHGSSASGVVAYSHEHGIEQAFSSAERVVHDGELRLYNSLAVKRYTRASEIAGLIDAVAREGVHVERWLPKAGLGSHPFDLRVVTVAGRASHFVVRLGRGPMTNLHLGNARGDAAQFVARISEPARVAAFEAGERAAAQFARCFHAGVDVLITRDHARTAVLEINAFGDLLPGVLDARGDDTYTAQVRAWLGRAS